MKKLWLVVLAVVGLGATVTSIKYFTDYPNSTPVDSDFFVLQRGTTYINSSSVQARNYFLSSPSFTGNGYIPGQWHAGQLLDDSLTANTVLKADGSKIISSIANGTGSLTNDGSGNLGWSVITGGTGAYIGNNNGNGTNTTNWGISTFQEIDVGSFYPTNVFTGLTNVVLGTDGNGQLIGTNVTSGSTYSNITENGYTVVVRSNMVVKGFLMESNSQGTVTLTNGSIVLTGTNAQPGYIASYNGATNLTLLFDGTNLWANVILSGSVYPTNLFTLKTNAVVLGTDGNGLLTSSSSLNTSNVLATPILWAGPSNSIVINNGYQQYATSTPTSITNQTTTSVWATLVISNSLATSITQYCTIPNIRYIGASSTNALTVGAGKVGIWSFLTFAGQLTNCVNNAQQ